MHMIFSKVGSTWQEVNYIGVSAGGWRDVSRGWVRFSGVWKLFFSVDYNYTDTLWAWGRNQYGQLGDGTTTQRTSPVKIGTSTWKAIAAGYYHSLGILSDDTLWAWGNNSYGQLGDGTTTQRTPPVKIGTSTWKAITGGRYHSLGIRGG